MKKTFLLTIFICFLHLLAYSTAQTPDIIIYEGKEYSLHTNPMEPFFEKHPDLKPQGGAISTGLWRGYRATFEVVENELLLRDIEILKWDTSATNIQDRIKWKSVIDEVFPDKKQIKIDWLSGLLVLPYGEIVDYVHMGYGSTYENYILLEFKDGNFLRSKSYDFKEYAEFKNKQFEKFKKTKEYKKLRNELRKEGDSDEFIESFLRNFLNEYTTITLKEE